MRMPYRPNVVENAAPPDMSPVTPVTTLLRIVALIPAAQLMP